MIVTYGHEKKSDCLVTVELIDKGISVELTSKVETLFGSQIKHTAMAVANEMNIDNAIITIKDYGALDFIIRARLKTAFRRALEMEAFTSE